MRSFKDFGWGSRQKDVISPGGACHHLVIVPKTHNERFCHTRKSCINVFFYFLWENVRFFLLTFRLGKMRHHLVIIGGMRGRPFDSSPCQKVQQKEDANFQFFMRTSSLILCVTEQMPGSNFSGISNYVRTTHRNKFLS